MYIIIKRKSQYFKQLFFKFLEILFSVFMQEMKSYRKIAFSALEKAKVRNMWMSNYVDIILSSIFTFLLHNTCIYYANRLNIIIILKHSVT